MSELTPAPKEMWVYNIPLWVNEKCQCTLSSIWCAYPWHTTFSPFLWMLPGKQWCSPHEYSYWARSLSMPPDKYSKGPDRLLWSHRHVFSLSVCWLNHCQLRRLSTLSSLFYSQWEHTLLTLYRYSLSKTLDEPDLKVSEWQLLPWFFQKFWIRSQEWMRLIKNVRFPESELYLPSCHSTDLLKSGWN